MDYAGSGLEHAPSAGRRCPYYSVVPKEYQANLEFRRRMVRFGAESPENAAALRQMCARDILFYVNVFCFIYEPRTARTHPFITYEYEDRLILALSDSIGRHDEVVAKSRDMGVTWSICAVLEHRWHWRDMNRFLAYSLKQELVDATDDPKTVFWKFDFLRRHQPRWLVPAVSRRKLHARNEDLDSTFTGDSTTAAATTGDRATAIFFDEFGKVPDGEKMVTSSRDVSPCRIFNSTPWPEGTAFRDLCENQNYHQIRIHWSMHPDKRRGLYRVDAGKVTVLDPDPPRLVRIVTAGTEKIVAFPSEYPFVTREEPGIYFRDGHVRSPWFDEQCKRANNPREIAQELEIAFDSAEYSFFDPAKLDRLIRDYVRPPFVKIPLSDILKTPSTADWANFWERMNGATLDLWVNPDALGDIPHDRSYGLGIDVASGTGSSNSAIAVVDRKTGEKIGEFVWPRIFPNELAHVAVAMGRWFRDSQGRGALMIWENRGPGTAFGGTVMGLGYGNVYFGSASEYKTVCKNAGEPGWNPSPENKRLLFEEYRQDLYSGAFINRSRMALDECRCFVYDAQTVSHRDAKHSEDPSGAGANHGDRATADALSNRTRTHDDTEKPVEIEPPYGSLAWKIREAERQEKADREECLEFE